MTSEMLQKQSSIKILDNSSGILGKCIGIYSKKKIAGIGDSIKVSVQKIKVKGTKNIKKGELLKVVVTQTKNLFKRASSIELSFNQNGGIFVTEEGKPIGTKVKGLVPKELRSKNSFRIAMISAGIV